MTSAGEEEARRRDAEAAKRRQDAIDAQIAHQKAVREREEARQREADAEAARRRNKK